MTDVFQHVAHDLQAVSLRDADGDDTVIISTDEDPYFVVDQGWTNARGLSPGDRVLTSNGNVMTVVANDDDKRPEGVVYNFAVEGNHTYFVNDDVGDGWAWVHNTCVYYTKDANGRVTEALAFITRSDLGTGTATTRAAKQFVRKFGNAGDEAGHLLTRILGGNGGVRSGNIAPIAGALNKGDLATFEKGVARLVRENGQAVVRIGLTFSGNSPRPDKINYVVESIKTLMQPFQNT